MRLGNVVHPYTMEMIWRCHYGGTVETALYHLTQPLLSPCLAAAQSYCQNLLPPICHPLHCCLEWLPSFAAWRYPMPNFVVSYWSACGHQKTCWDDWLIFTQRGDVQMWCCRIALLLCFFVLSLLDLILCRLHSRCLFFFTCCSILQQQHLVFWEALCFAKVCSKVYSLCL